ncbi:MAG: chemotaxis protein, partial [Methylocapsa sp.]|nr:chemotaxis protein [Methylocapsa sp.]
MNTKPHGEARERPVIVGIGASAGGVHALQAFFEALPVDTGAAFVVVVHLDPGSHSQLSSILATRTRMPVVQVEGTQELRANHVYVIAPARRLHISDREISSEEYDEPRGRRAPIDLFFRSLAEQHTDGFAVILTGAGSDGAVGVRAVKEAGGIILVQDPSEADYPSMPRAAIETGIADFILPVHELGTCLAELLHKKDSIPDLDEGNFDEDMVRRILAHERVRTGHDFSKYKRSTILRRIARRMQITKTDDLSGYYNFLRENNEEADALLGDLLISVTTFFRDGDAFDSLKDNVIPRLFEGKEPSEPIRVWVAGCATGEEAYSLGILLLEEASRHDIRPPLQLFGSDLDTKALAIARDGIYPAAIEADVNEERLRRFFAREGDRYRVRREVRDTVVFAVHDLLKDPPFSRIDLISCRNVLIYLDRELQQQICSTFHYSLNPYGYLLLGSAETAESPPGLFRMTDRKARIYQAMPQPEGKPRLMPRLLGSVGHTEQRPHVQGAPLSPRAVLSEAAL